MPRLFIVILLISFRAFCQDADTLFPHILSIQNDTEQVNQLYSNGFALRNKDPKLAYVFASEAEKAAKRSTSLKHIAKSYNLLGILFYKKGNYSVALNYHRKALMMRQAINDVLGIAISEQNLGNVFSDLQLFHKAERSYLNAMNAYKHLGNTKKIIDCLNNIGILKHQQKEFDSAIENYLMALQLVPENDYESKAFCLSNIGEAYLGKHNIEKAEGYNEDALKLRMMSDNRVESGDSYVNLGSILILKKDYETSKRYLDSAYNIALHYEYFELLLKTTKAYAYYFEETKNFEAAYKWMKQHDEMRSEMLVKQQAQSRLFDFDETQSSYQKTIASNKINNLWLLISVALCVIIIPFIFIQFKR